MSYALGHRIYRVGWWLVKRGLKLRGPKRYDAETISLAERYGVKLP